MRRKKLAYWITDRVTDHHRGKTPLLIKLGYDITFFSNLTLLMAAFTEQRVSTIIISDEGSLDHLYKLISKITSIPELAGVRLILSYSGQHPELVSLSYKHGFRDIIPLDLDLKTWTQRLLFSSSGSPVHLKLPEPQLTLNNVSSLNLPARVTWFSPKRICLETKASPPPGTVIKFKGRIADHLGVKGITLTVEENTNTNLKFRYSEAIICRWTTTGDENDRLSSLLNHFKNVDEGPVCKVFLAIKSPTIRTTLLNQLSGPSFEISTALHRQSLTHEPKFFSPHVVFIEDVVCSMDDYQSFAELVEATPVDVPIIIIGRKVDTKAVKSYSQGHKVTLMHQTPSNLDEILTKRILTDGVYRTTKDTDAVVVGTSSNFSFGELTFAAAVTRLHPQSVQFTIPFRIGNFGLCRIDSPFIKSALGRSAYIKIVHTYNTGEAQRFSYLAEGYFADLLQSDRDQLAKSMIDMLIDQYMVDNASRSALKESITELTSKESIPAPAPLTPNRDEVILSTIEPRITSKTPPKPVPIHKPARVKPKIDYRLSGREIAFVVLIVIIFGAAGISMFLMSDINLSAGKVFSDSVTKYRNMQEK